MCGSAFDIALGRKIRKRRELLGLTQAQTAERLGIRPQMISRYELGENPISASMVWKLSEVLDQPIEAFFQGLSRSQPACVRPSGGTGPQSQHSDGKGQP